MPGVRILDVGLACLALYVVGRFVRARRNPLPPGPPGWPLIGNLLPFIVHAPHKTWGAMSQKYGPIISLKLLGTRYVVINSSKVAKDLLEKESAITSNRPRLTMGCDLVGLDNFTPFLQYGDSYRKHSKFYRQHIGTNNSLEVFYPAEEAEAKRLVRSLLRNPEDLEARCRRMAGAVILQISHGYTVKEDSDPLLEMADRLMDILTMIMTPGRFLVDVFPILRYLPEWFPGGGFHKDARRWRKLLRDTVLIPYEFVLDHLAKGDAAPSFMSRALREGVTPEEEELLKWASFSMYMGGSETVSQIFDQKTEDTDAPQTPSELFAFFLAMTMYPEVLKKAQAEVDTVIGNDRLPTCRDRGALPYINAICIELLRWHVANAFAVRMSTQDIVYEGYLIPKGTTILPNIWFMLSDPETYPKPEIFDPERYLGEDRQPDPREVCFGWGRRSCPGARQAELTIFACVATVVAVLDVSRCVENGVECVPRYESTEKIARHVKPFKCRIAPRSKMAEDLLQV